MPFVPIASVPSSDNPPITRYRTLVWTKAQKFGADVRSNVAGNIADQLAVHENANCIRVVGIALDHYQLGGDFDIVSIFAFPAADGI